MCGLVGIAGHLTQADSNILVDLLKVSAPFRGEDSTGVFSVGRYSKSNAVRMLKQVGPPYELINTVGFSTVIQGTTSRGLFGHVRKKTVGDVSRHTAHPFFENDVIGMHNGTLLHGWQKLTDETYPVDSQAIMAALSQTDDPVPVLEKLNGAFALIWFDQRTGYLNIARNEQRQLWYAFSKDRKRIFWASEWQFLEFVLGKHNIEVWTTEKGQGYFLVAPMELHVLDLRIEGKDATAIERVSNRPFEKAKSPVTTHHGGQHGWSQRSPRFEASAEAARSVVGTAAGVPSNPFVPGVNLRVGSPATTTPSTPLLLPPKDGSCCHVGDSPESTPSPTSPQNSSGSGSSRPKLSLVDHTKDNVLQLFKEDELNDSVSDVGVFDDEVKGPKGLILNRTSFDSLVEDGCQWCQKGISFEDEKKGVGVYRWLDNGKFLCHECKPVLDSVALQC